MDSDPKIQECYKIVVIDFDSSLVSHVAHGSLEVQYAVGLWTFPVITGTKLFAFKDLQSAQFYARLRCDYNYTELYKAECYDPNPMDYVLHPFYLYRPYLDAVVEYWTGKGKSICAFDKMRAPSGTISTKAIKLLEKIEW